MDAAPDDDPADAAAECGPNAVARPAHLAPQAAAALALPAEQRILFAQTDRWIPYARAAQAMKRANDLVASPRTTSPRGMLVLGKPGNGKTTIANRIAAAHPPTVRATGDVTAPVIAMEMSPGADLSTFWSDLLFACAAAHRTTENWRQKKLQAASVLTTLAPRAFVFDEVNEIGRGRPADQGLLMGELKWLSNKFSAPLILLGSEEAADVVQFTRPLTRRSPDFVLNWWNGDPELPGLLDTFEAILPLPERSHLSDPGMMGRLEELHDGTIGSIAVVLKEAATIAIELGRDRIDPDVLAKVTPDTDEARRRRRAQL